MTISGMNLAAAILTAWVWVLVVPMAQAHPGDILGFHGSGTTNPSKCFWAIMEDMRDQTLHPVHMTYRAVGSTTGIVEFVNNYTTAPAADFGSGDLPLPKTEFDGLQAKGIGMLHLPILLGAVSFFYNIDEIDKLDLDACLLARIFKRDITSWGHADIVAMNPELEGSTLKISVARRVQGSSSTSAITSYLRDACPDHWPQEMVGATITWPEDTLACEGSGGVTSCITGTAGTIGYLDAGHGIGEGLPEIELKNKAGTVQTSADAAERGGIGAAEPDLSIFPLDGDFSGVSLVNRDGEFTWPIVLMTYVYVRKDLSFITDPEGQTLLKAFLKNLYNDDYVKQCVNDHGFFLPTTTLRQAALLAIDTQLQINPIANEWVIESSTAPITGMGDFVISQKRRTHNEVERDDMKDQIAALQANQAALELMLKESQASLARVEEDNFDKDGMLSAALVLGIFGVVLSLSALGCVMCATVGKHQNQMT